MAAETADTQREALSQMRGVARQSIKEDLLQFTLPGVLIFLAELILCGERLDGFWGEVWALIKRPQDTLDLPVVSFAGLCLFFIGLSIMTTGQITLRRNYSGTRGSSIRPQTHHTRHLPLLS